jgi:exosortase
MMAAPFTGQQRLVIGALLIAFGLTYATVIAGLVRQWATDDNYSHGFFVVPLAIYFAWQRRSALARAEFRPSGAGVLVIAASLLLYLAGVLGAELFLTRVSLVGVIAGTVLYLFGRQHARILAFPVGFLFLMIPLPALVFNQLTFPLQLFASQLGEGVIAAAGVPVLREGNILYLPSRSLELVEACSGIRSLVSLLMLAIVLGSATACRTWHRIVIAFAAVPLAILANVTRVAGTGLASEWVSPAAAEGFFHVFSGWLLFLMASGGLLIVRQALRCRAPDQTLEPA